MRSNSQHLKPTQTPQGDRELSERLELFFGQASPTVCRVYARIRGIEDRAGLRLCGSLTGPTCMYANTLPATFAFRDLGPGESVLAEAVVPEPCFWSPDMPHLYRAEVRLERDQIPLARAGRDFGIRPLGTSSRKLVYDSKRFVLRGVYSSGVCREELALWRDCGAAMLVDEPDHQLCQRAAATGVLLMAAFGQLTAASLNRMAQCAAVGFVLVRDAFVPLPDALRDNLVLAQYFAADQAILPEPWAQVAVCDVGRPESLAERGKSCQLPVIALRPGGKHSGIEQARAECDRLQRDLAGLGDYAGYIVSTL